MNTRGQEARRIEVFRQMPPKVSLVTFSETPGHARDKSRILAQYIGQSESVRNTVYMRSRGERSFKMDPRLCT